MQQLTFSDFNKRLLNKAAFFRRPISGQWALTNNCNLRCLHCYVVKKKNSKELKFNQITDIMEQLYKEGCLELTLTGGEPFIRKDFLDIYKYAKEKGFLITIFTNGTLLNPKMVAYLEKYPPFMIEVTLHSLNKDIFDTITNAKGSFQRCMQGIKLIMERNLPLTIKTVGMSLNKSEIHKIKDFVNRLRNVKFKFDPFICVRQDGSKEVCKLRLSQDDILKIEFSDKEIRYQWQECLKNKNNFIEKEKLFSCEAGLNSFYINPYGELQLCPEMPRPVFDLKKGSFKEGFYDFLYNLRWGDYNINSPCRNCEIYYLCGQCPARNVIENGDMNKPVEYLCRLAHKMADMINKKEKGVELAKAD